jgi:hypothetical protein
MTSSYLLKKRFENAKTWSFGNADSPLGGWEDHYIRPYAECHPDYEALPIEHPMGVKVCVKRKIVEELDQSRCLNNTIASETNGYHRGSVRLYDPQANYPVQKWNPSFYADRRIPWEGQALHNDYLRWQSKYSGTGVKLVHAPAEGRDTGHPYYQYAYSYTPYEDPATGLRTATSPAQSAPFPKYDVTRLNQAYPQWKAEQKYMGVNQDHNDTTYFNRIA